MLLTSPPSLLKTSLCRNILGFCIDDKLTFNSHTYHRVKETFLKRMVFLMETCKNVHWLAEWGAFVAQKNVLGSVEFMCSPRSCVGSLQVLLLPPTVQKHAFGVEVEWIISTTPWCECESSVSSNQRQENVEGKNHGNSPVWTKRNQILRERQTEKLRVEERRRREPSF